jgi:hypothetical protein
VESRLKPDFVKMIFDKLALGLSSAIESSSYSAPRVISIL